MNEYYEMMTAGEIVKRIIDKYEVPEAEPVIYEHTCGFLSGEEITHWLKEMFANTRTDPGTLPVSVEDCWYIRFAWLYGQHRLPKRKLRKCVLRKRQAKINQGKRCLERRRQCERRTRKASHRDLVDAVYGVSPIEKLVEEGRRHE